MGVQTSKNANLGNDPETILVGKICAYFLKQEAKCFIPPALQRPNVKQHQRLEVVKKKLGLWKHSAPQKYETAKALLNFDRRKYNIAVTGVSGSGKSTFINAIRAMRDGDRQEYIMKTSYTNF